MKIFSRFKDYYDYVANMYGGGDPSIMYMRNRLTPFRFEGGSSYSSDLPIVQEGIRGLPRIHYSLTGVGYYNTKWLAVMGKYYLMVSYVDRNMSMNPWRILDPVEHQKLYENLTSKKSFDETKGGDYWLGSPDDKLLELTRKVGTPVFIFSATNLLENTILVEPEIPILRDIDFQKFFSPEQFYQELAYFMGNTMHVSPDLSPPSKSTDKEKIQQHGFDLKQSFRHRK